MNKHIDWFLHIQISFAQLSIGMKIMQQLGKAKIRDNTEITIVIEKSYGCQIYKSTLTHYVGT